MKYVIFNLLKRVQLLLILKYELKGDTHFVTVYKTRTFALSTLRKLTL